MLIFQRFRHAATAAVLLAAVAMLQPACSSGPRSSGDPVADLKSKEYSIEDRAAAMKVAWEKSGASPEERATFRETLKEMAWDVAGTPTDLRLRAIETLINDPDEAGAADARKMARLMLPREQSRSVVAYICSVAASRNWTDFTPALVRSWARPVPQVKDSERGERTALVALHPGVPPEQVVLDVFLNPPKQDQIAGVDTEMKLRLQAWDLLQRLDPRGEFRLHAVENVNSSNDPLLADIQNCARQFGIVPRTGDEIAWARSLLDPKNDANAAWLRRVNEMLGALTPEQRAGLELRHLAAIQWASDFHTSWLSASRTELLSELESRLAPRDRHRRSVDATDFRRPVKDDLATWKSQLVWADILDVLVVDEAVHEATSIASAFQQGDLDYKDSTTEYGGIVEAKADAPGATTPSRFRLRLFPPRASQRFADDRFVASDDLIAAADRALAIYHFHAQSRRNDSYAGPSDGDLGYAARSGRTCLVFTFMSPDRMNVDLYQPDGVLLDLGDIERPGS